VTQVRRREETAAICLRRCDGCDKEDVETTFTREMKPGAHGGMGQSFARCYDLCDACLDRCREAGALIGIQRLNASGKKITPRAKVKAKTLQWLKAK
jgi:hypothetical protein